MQNSRVCTCMCVLVFIALRHEKGDCINALVSALLFFLLLRTEKGQVLPRGRILNTLACAKNVDILTKKTTNP